MTLEEAQELYDFTDLQNYPNVGYLKGEIAELSFDGNILIRPYNSELLMTQQAIDEWLKCKDDMYYFFETYCKIHTQDHGKIIVKLRDFQKEFLDLIHNNSRVIGLIARQSGKTVTNALYIVWNLCFNKDWVALVVANEDDLKKEIVELIQTIYENLPPFLQCGVANWNMGSISIQGMNEDNKVYYNKLKSAIAGKNAGRGKTPNFILSDEAAWYDPSKAKAYFDSVKASLSSGTNNKFVMISTPQGYNIFHDYWKDAVEGISGFKPYFANWRCVPGRDEKWKEQKIKEDNLTPLEWAQNYECSYIGSSSTLLSADTLSKLSAKKPIQEDFITIGTKVYQPFNPDAKYLITCDSSKTVGKSDADNDYISINVLEMNSKIKQVLTYRTNDIHYTEIAKILNQIGSYYNYGLVVIENNSGDGQSIADKLFETFEYPNVYCDPKHNGLIKGTRTTTSRKQIGLKNLKKLIEDYLLELYDKETIDEFFTFIKVGKSYQAQSSSTDDVVMSLCTGLLVLEDPLNDLELTLEDYLKGEVETVDYDEDTTDVDFMVSSKGNSNTEDTSWLLQ